MSRNVPPVSEAVQWARQLLRRVENPMEVFKNNSTVMQSVVSGEGGTLYLNRGGQKMDMLVFAGFITSVQASQSPGDCTGQV